MPTAASKSQQQHQQQGEAQPASLDALPAPALRRVLQLASTPETPAICPVSCVSRTLRVASEAAAPSIHLTVRPDRFATSPFVYNPAADNEVEARYASLRAWLRCHAWCIRGLRVLPGYGPETLEADLLQHLASGIPLVAAAAAEHVDNVSQRPAAAAEHLDDVSQGAAAAAAVAATGVAAAAISAVPADQAIPLQRLHLGPTSTAAACFKQLQVLVLTGEFHKVHDTGRLLKQILPSLQHLQRLALHTYYLPYVRTGDALLRSLPPSLRALDLHIAGSDACSSSSLAHLVHLTSLRIDRVDLLEGVGDATSSEQQQQQQEEEEEQQEPLGGVATTAQAAQQQQGRQQPLALRALSMRPLSQNCWFAAPWLEEVELFFGSFLTPSLEQLAVCRRLRQLSVTYYYHLPGTTGVSMLTQLTHLRLQPIEVPQAYSSLASVGAELANLEQLQVLEARYGCLEAMQPRNWLPHMRCLTQLVTLSVSADQLEPLQHLAGVITEWSSSSSSGGDSSTSGVDGGSSGAHISGPSPVVAATPASSSQLEGVSCSLPAIAACKLQRLVLVLPSPERPPPGSRQAKALSALQQAAADMDTAHPWLQVVVQDTDDYACPCWVGAEEDEEELNDEQQ